MQEVLSPGASIKCKCLLEQQYRFHSLADLNYTLLDHQHIPRLKSELNLFRRRVIICRRNDSSSSYLDLSRFQPHPAQTFALSPLNSLFLIPILLWEQ